MSKEMEATETKYTHLPRMFFATFYTSFALMPTCRRYYLNASFWSRKMFCHWQATMLNMFYEISLSSKEEDNEFWCLAWQFLHITSGVMWWSDSRIFYKPCTHRQLKYNITHAAKVAEQWQIRLSSSASPNLHKGEINFILS